MTPTELGAYRAQPAAASREQPESKRWCLTVFLQLEADMSAGRRETDPRSTHSHIYQSCIHVLVIIAALAVGFFA